MIETVTEPFCERCGTRYEFFVPVVGKKRRGRGLTTLLGGRSTPEAKPVAGALDPFLTVFRFCLECRQYTCRPCWNEEAGFCATCVPFPDAPPEGPPQVLETIDEPVVERLVVGPDAWSTVDLAESPAATVVAIPELPELPEVPDIVAPSAASSAHEAAPVSVVADPPGLLPTTSPEVETDSDLASAVAWNRSLLGTTPAGDAEGDDEPPQDWAALFEGTPEAEAEPEA